MQAPSSSSEEGHVQRREVYPSHQDIEREAYFLWLDEGCPDGSAEHDWHEAERRLRAEQEETDRRRAA